MRSLIKLESLEQMLIREGLKYFYPKSTKLIRGKDGLYTEVKAIIPPYVFIYSQYEQIRKFKQKKDSISFIPTLGRTEHTTMKVSNREMEDFIRVVSQMQEKTHIYQAGEIEIPKGKRIRICGGVLDGVEGTLVKIKGIRDKRLVVSIPGIMFASTPIEKTFIQILD
jgi:transcription antitermination factor NusG